MKYKYYEANSTFGENKYYVKYDPVSGQTWIKNLEFDQEERWYKSVTWQSPPTTNWRELTPGELFLLEL